MRTGAAQRDAGEHRRRGPKPTNRRPGNSSTSSAQKTTEDNRGPAEARPKQEPRRYILEAHENGLTTVEIRTMAEVANKKGGRSSYDYADPISKIVPRCPVGGCSTRHQQGKAGQPVNANGLAKKLRSHIAQERPNKRRDRTIWIIRRIKKSREGLIACATKPAQNRKGRDWGEREGGEESKGNRIPSHDTSHIDVKDHSTRKQTEKASKGKVDIRKFAKKNRKHQVQKEGARAKVQRTRHARRRRTQSKKSEMCDDEWQPSTLENKNVAASKRTFDDSRHSGRSVSFEPQLSSSESIGAEEQTRSRLKQTKPVNRQRASCSIDK